MNPEEFEKPKEENQEKQKSKLICAWCKKIMGEVEGMEGGMDSHGICKDCREKYFPSKKASEN